MKEAQSSSRLVSRVKSQLILKSRDSENEISLFFLSRHLLQTLFICFLFCAPPIVERDQCSLPTMSKHSPSFLFVIIKVTVKIKISIHEERDAERGERQISRLRVLEKSSFTSLRCFHLVYSLNYLKCFISLDSIRSSFFFNFQRSPPSLSFDD
jgi:hypothetical protein